MKKLMFAALGLCTLLAACGGGGSNPTPAAPKPTTTLNQGVWGWAIADVTTEKTIDGGAIILNQEINGDYGKVAGGVYSNQARTQQGITVMGPMTAQGKLETAFSYDPTTSSRFYLVAADDDGKMENYEGKATFFGGGALLDANNKPSRQVYIAIVQTSTTVPTGDINTQKAYAAKVAQDYAQAAAREGSATPLSSAAIKRLVQLKVPELGQ